RLKSLITVERFEEDKMCWRMVAILSAIPEETVGATKLSETLRGSTMMTVLLRYRFGMKWATPAAMIPVSKAARPIVHLYLSRSRASPGAVRCSRPGSPKPELKSLCWFMIPISWRGQAADERTDLQHQAKLHLGKCDSILCPFIRPKNGIALAQMKFGLVLQIRSLVSSLASPGNWDHEPT